VKPITIIAISVVCSVVAVIAVLSFSGVDFSEVDVGESVANIVPFDCAKAWETMMGSLRVQDNDAFQKLSPEERKEIRQDETKIRDKYHANWCSVNHEEWEGRVEKYKEEFAESYLRDYRASWETAIATEYEYNERFPDGAWQFQ